MAISPKDAAEGPGGQARKAMIEKAISDAERWVDLQIVKLGGQAIKIDLYKATGKARDDLTDDEWFSVSGSLKRKYLSNGWRQGELAYGPCNFVLEPAPLYWDVLLKTKRQIDIRLQSERGKPHKFYMWDLLGEQNPHEDAIIKELMEFKYDNVKRIDRSTNRKRGPVLKFVR